MEQLSRKKKNFYFMIAWGFVGFALFLNYYRAWCKDYNTTLLAFSYKYGFISRGFLGTIYQGIGKVFGIDMFSYVSAMRFMEISTVLFFLIFLIFIMACLKYCSEESYRYVPYLGLLYTIFTIPTFSCEFNFGRVDLFMLSMSLIGVILLLCEKMEWLVIPVSALGVMFHQGYVFMFYNVLLALLFYKILSTHGKKQKKYILIFGLSLMLCGALFLWFQLFSHGNGEAYLAEIVHNARLVGRNQKIHLDLIRAEIVGIDLTEEEKKYRACNIEDIICFTILMSPYIVTCIQFLRGLLTKAQTAAEKWKYLAVAAGALTMVPDFLLKVDFGRWTYAVISYYMITILSLLAMGDKNTEQQVKRVMDNIYGKPWAALFLVYPILFVPFHDVVITETIDRVCILVRQFIL